jgi:hypothetical protein
MHVAQFISAAAALLLLAGRVKAQTGGSSIAVDRFRLAPGRRGINATQERVPNRPTHFATPCHSPAVTIKAQSYAQAAYSAAQGYVNIELLNGEDAPHPLPRSSASGTETAETRRAAT